MNFKRSVASRRAAPPSQRLNPTYYRSRPKTVESPSPKRSRRSSRILKSILGRATESLILLLLLAVFIYSLIVNPSPSVKINSQLYHDVATYRASLQRYMSSFTDRNKITFDSAALFNKMQHDYPEISNLQVKLPLIGQKPTITITIALPGFKLVSGGQAYLVGEQGTVVAYASNINLTQNFPVLDDQSGFKIELGKPALDNHGVIFIKNLLAQLKAAKAPVSKMILPAKAEELDLSFSDKNYYVKLFLGGDWQTEVGQILAARHYFAKTHRQPSKYLDVRVPGKIFYL